MRCVELKEDPLDPLPAITIFMLTPPARNLLIKRHMGANQYRMCALWMHRRRRNPVSQRDRGVTGHQPVIRGFKEVLQNYSAQPQGIDPRA
jgi:hypothetical protein